MFGFKRVLMAAVLGGAGLLPATGAQAAYITYMYQNGANVTASGSGSINFTGLSFFGNGSSIPTVMAAQSTLLIGAPDTTALYSVAIAGPTGFGSGALIRANSGTGGLVYLQRVSNTLGVPVGTVSGANLGLSTATWNNITLAALGVVNGTYRWTWGAGANADSYTLIVGQAPPVPEPATLALLAAPLGGLLLRRRRAV